MADGTPVVFDGFPYLQVGEALVLLPGGLPPGVLRRRVEDALARARLNGVLVERPGDAPGPLRCGELRPRELEIDLTETAELLARGRYLRVWLAACRGAALPVGRDGWSDLSVRRYSGAANSLRRLRPANEISRVLAAAHAAGAGLPAHDPMGFLRVASWYETMPELMDAGLFSGWRVWLESGTATLPGGE